MERIILKISGEALKSEEELVSKKSLDTILNSINIIRNRGYKVGIVVGGGNILRGREHEDMDVINRDTIGMLGTVINAIFIKDYLVKNNFNAVVSTPFSFPNLIPDYSNEELKEKDIVIFGGGTGMSGYSTDSGTITAKEMMDADMIIKLTNVDGVYDKDPHKYNDAIKFAHLSYDEVLDKELNVMDLFAISKCKEYNTKLLVIEFSHPEEIDKYFDGLDFNGTIID